MATTPKKPTTKPSAPPAVIHLAPVAPPVAPVAEVPLSDWSKTPASVQHAFADMLAALERIPNMQGAHGLDCHCSYCGHVKSAIAGARAITS